MSKIGRIIRWSRNHIEGLLSNEVKASYDFSFKGMRVRPGIYFGVLDTRHVSRHQRVLRPKGNIDSRIEYHLNAVKFHSMVLGKAIEKRKMLEKKYYNERNERKGNVSL